MVQLASLYYSTIFDMLPLSPQQRWQWWMQPHQAFLTDKTAAKRRRGHCFSSCLWAPQLTFLYIQLVRLITGVHSETNHWQDGLAHPDWPRQIRIDLPGLGIQAVSTETHGLAEEGEYFEVWKNGEWIQGRQTCSECFIQFALIQ